MSGGDVLFLFVGGNVSLRSVDCGWDRAGEKKV